MQRLTKKKLTHSEKRHLKTTDENVVPRKASHMKKVHGKSSFQIKKPLNMTEDINLMCQSIQQRNRDSQLMIAKLLENRGRQPSSKTIRKQVKNKQSDFSQFILYSSREFNSKGKKIVSPQWMNRMNRTDTKNISKQNKSLSKMISDQRNLLRQMSTNVNHIFH